MPITYSPPPFSCSVVRADVGQGAQVRGRLLSATDVHGTYRMAITKAGPSGTSTINQAGRFSAPANIETYLGSATVSLEPGSNYIVHLSVEVGNQTFECEPVSGIKI